MGDRQQREAAVRVAWRNDAQVLPLSQRALHNLQARWSAGSLFAPTPRELAFFSDESGVVGAELLITCAASSVSLWPSLHTRADNEARLLGVHAALRCALQLDARGCLGRCARTGLRCEVTSTDSLCGVLWGLLNAATDSTGVMRRLRASGALSRADEAALRHLHAASEQTWFDPRREAGVQARHATFAADQVASAAADAARHGLRRCALPACAVQEPHPKLFKLCGRCHAAAYCCAAHSVEDWKRHKREDGCKAAP
jgi:hypothetical protein